MAYFDAVVAAHLAGRTVREALLVSLEFTSQTMRLWGGTGTLSAGGFDWSGLSDLASVGDLQLGPGVPEDEVVFTLTGLEHFLPGQGAALSAMLADQKSELTGRSCRIWQCFFDEDWRQLAAPVVLRTLIMDRLRRESAMAETGGHHLLHLHCEPRTIDKHRQGDGLLTDQDQQTRHAGDLALERLTAYAGEAGNREW